MSKSLMKNSGLLIGGAFITWSAIVISSGWGFNLSGVQWDFGRTAQLGDSFGILSAGMASIAAYFAFRTYRSAIDQAKNQEIRETENAFLNLIERRYDVLERVDFGKMSGQRALNSMMAHICQVKDISSKSIEEIYAETASTSLGLSNHFRFCYQIISFADSSLNPDDTQPFVEKYNRAYISIRLLRALISDTEMGLIALNCIYGLGVRKFKPLIEKYALLHNLDGFFIETFELDKKFQASAFGLKSEDRDPDQDYSSVIGHQPTSVDRSK